MVSKLSTSSLLISSKYISPAQTFPLNYRITCPVAFLTSSLGYLTKFSNSTSKTKFFTFKSCSLKNLSISVNINCILLVAQSKTLEISPVPPSRWRAASSPLTNTLALFLRVNSESSHLSPTALLTPGPSHHCYFSSLISLSASTLVPSSSVCFQHSSQSDAVKTQIVTSQNL